MVAQLILYSYPLVVLVLFRRLPRHTALIWSVLMGYLFLPENTGIDLPLLPAFNKGLIPSLTAAVMCLMLPDAGDPRSTAMRRRQGDVVAEDDDGTMRRGSLLANLCLLLLFLVPIGVFVTNTDPVVAGPRRIPGLRIYDIFSMILNFGVMLIPFVLARRYLASPAAQLALLRALVIGGLIYALLILIEVRLSPQLNRWIYGFYAHSFQQHIRGGGFRPMVFLEHGLRVGIFISMASLAAFALWRVRAEDLAAATAGGPVRPTRATPDARSRRAEARKPLPTTGRYLLYGLWLVVIVVLSKTFGALLITLALAPLILFLGARLRLIAALCLALLVLVYPMMRKTDTFPIDSVFQVMLSLDAERAYSFNFRVQNEDALLDRADVKPAFGWGAWGRARIYDSETGRDLSVTDGVWVISFGQWGWFGYLAQFGLLTLPIIGLAFRRDRIGTITSGLCLVMAANLVDMIPNSSMTPLTWLIAGSLMGAYERVPRQTTRTQSERPARRTPARPLRPARAAGRVRPG